ncbi:MAG: aminotransferase class V-fold PLP-dependent enzyme [Gammaproteobacteria bacterium]|nr:aminotransferase class V-fold PLP-dependent enzyme [Gammaproteobacteria bacterium]
MRRRRFLSSVGEAGGAALVTTLFGPETIRSVEAAAQRTAGTSPEDLARDENYWSEIQQAFSVTRSIINLNNGGVCPSPRMVTEAFVRYIWESEEAPVYTMWQILQPRKENVRQRLAVVFGCDPEEVALVRNTSEAMEILLLGMDLQSGDEILTTTQDYGRMLTTIRQRVRREGIDLKFIQIPTPAETDEEVVEGFRGAITDKTRIILMSHQINLTGQILPVKAVCDLARERGIEVMVDGAHSFAQFDFKLEDIGCDYFGTSLHKWLLAPKGTGMLYVKKDKIPKIWPMMPAPERMDEDIRKYEEIGTHPAANFVAVGEAITFHNTVGAKNKEARLRYLKDTWADRLSALPNTELHTSRDPRLSCAIGNINLTTVEPPRLRDYFWEKHHIIVTPIMHEEFQGLRITPNLYTTMAELDYFCNVYEDVARNGLPKSA